VLQLNRALQILERLLRRRGYHVRKGDVVFDRMGEPEAIEGAMEVSKFVGGKLPISILPGLPEPFMLIIRSLMLGRYSAARGEGAASGPAATLREVARPITRMVAPAKATAAGRIGRRCRRAGPASLMRAPAARQAAYRA
jgi:hypothetical protein